jgi:hypothetical protein
MILKKWTRNFIGAACKILCYLCNYDSHKIPNQTLYTDNFFVRVINLENSKPSN